MMNIRFRVFLEIAITLSIGLVESQASSIASWSAPANVPLAPNSSVDQEHLPYLNHRMMLSSDGHIVLAAWTSYDCYEDPSGCRNITYSSAGTRVDNIISWGPVIEICENCLPTYSLAANGRRAIATWTEGENYHRKLISSVATLSSNKVSWSKPEELSTTDDIAGVQVQINANGDKATAIWVKSTAVVQSASATISDKSAAWGKVSTLSKELSIRDIKIAASSNGTQATAVWNGSDYSQRDPTTSLPLVVIQTASALIKANSADWGITQNISLSSDDTTMQTPLELAISPDGASALAAWVSIPAAFGYEPKEWQLKSSRALITGSKSTWSNPTIIHKCRICGDLSMSSSINGYKALAMISDLNGGDFIFSNFYSDNYKISDLTPIATLDYSGSSPIVRLAPDGMTATALWSSRFDDYHQSQISSASATISASGPSWEKATVLSEKMWRYDESSPPNPQLNISLDGRMAIASWVSQKYYNNTVTFPALLYAVATITPANEPPQPTPSYSLIVDKKGEGIVASTSGEINCGDTCTGKFSKGTTLSLSAKPSPSYYFSGWQGECSGKGECTITLDRDIAITAFFTPTNTTLTINKSSYGLVTSIPESINCGNQSKLCSGVFSNVTLTATPNPGYYLKKWMGCPSPTGNTCSLSLTKKTTVGAVFAKLPKYALKIVKTKNGEITSDPSGLKCKAAAKTCSFNFVSGTRVTLNPIPVPGYNFTGWSGPCTGTGSCEVLMDAKQSVGAQFE